MSTKIYRGQVILLLVNCGGDVTTGVNPTLRVLKPDGEVVSWPAQPNGTTFLSYTTNETDLDQIGTYSVQANPDLPSGNALGETATFEVSEYFR